MANQNIFRSIASSALSVAQLNLRFKMALAVMFSWVMLIGLVGVVWGQSSPRPPAYLPISQSLSTPAANNQYLIPVVIISYLPTADNIYLDSSVTNYPSTLADLSSKIDIMSHQTKYGLEEGSRYHGYKAGQAQPALGYKVVANIEVYESLPISGFRAPASEGKPEAFYPDYDQILNRFNARNYVEQQGVKEFWIWGYHHGKIEPVESDMASPTRSGDVSNSVYYPHNLPIYNKTYILYNYNYATTAANALHDHGHQLEKMLAYVNNEQDGNTDLWRRKFIGFDANGNSGLGRVGWTHSPPNTTSEYVYDSPTLVDSDIEDWTPNRTGQLKAVNGNTWININRNWPYSAAYLDGGSYNEAQWHTY